MRYKSLAYSYVQNTAHLLRLHGKTTSMSRALRFEIAVAEAGEVQEDRQYPAAEMERMIKLQDVLLKAMAKKIAWWDAAETIGATGRTMRRWRAEAGINAQDRMSRGSIESMR